MFEPNAKRIYHKLVVEAESASTEIWVIDNNGHPVQREVGVFRSELIPGEYFVEFDQSRTVYPINLKSDVQLTEVRLRAGKSCPHPEIRLLPDID